MKESEKIDKYLDFGRKLKKLWNMKVTVITIAVFTLATVFKSLEELKNERKNRDHRDSSIVELD